MFWKTGVWYAIFWKVAAIECGHIEKKMFWDSGIWHIIFWQVAATDKDVLGNGSLVCYKH